VLRGRGSDARVREEIHWDASSVPAPGRRVLPYAVPSPGRDCSTIDFS
jgi:hypothetical protein